MTFLLTDQLRMMADSYPDAAGYRILGGGSMTFSQWEQASNQLARGLVDLGVSKGDRVAIYFETAEALQWILSYSAVHKAGAVVVPLNTRLAPRELALILEHSGTRAILTAGDLAANARSLAAGVESVRWLVTGVHEAARGPNGATPSGATPSGATPSGATPSGATPSGATPAGDAREPSPATTAATAHPAAELSLQEVLSTDQSAFQVDVTEDDLADIMYTSGTTGMPKGVAVRHKSSSLLPNAVPSWLGTMWLHSSPLFTFAGVSFVYNPMKLGMTGLYQPQFDAAQWIRAVEEERPTAAFIVPAMARLLLTHPDFETADLSSITILAIGSAPITPHTLKALQQRMPSAMVTNGYGLTEAGPAFCAMPAGESERRTGSVGQPLPPMEVRISTDGLDQPAGKVGEVLIRMPGREREYFNDPEATARTWVDGWLHTGDLGYLDEDGYLYLVGREKEVVIRGGNNIYPIDVEAAILEHPAVEDAAVIGIPHDVLGEDIAAFVELRQSATLSVDELRSFCAERLADYKVPRKITFVDALPRNATGKVLKRELSATGA